MARQGDSGFSDPAEADTERPTLSHRVLRAKIRFMFQAIVTRLHSPRTLSSPRSRNWRKPSTDLTMPNTGSGVCFSPGVELLAFGRGQAVHHGFERGRVLRCRRCRGKALIRGRVMRGPAERQQRLDPCRSTGRHIGSAEITIVAEHGLRPAEIRR